MGFNDREIVALLGAHALGRCHTDRSGYWGPWTFAGEFREMCMCMYEISTLWFIIFLPLHVL